MPETYHTNESEHRPTSITNRDNFQLENQIHEDTHQDESKWTLSPTSILPPEVMIEVFSHLSPGDLDNASLVCRHWYDILTNEASWRESFSRIFSITRFNRITSSLKWRTELFTRMDCMRKWRKGTAKNLSFNCYMNVSHVFTDFSAARIMVFSAAIGMGMIADPTKGKLAKPPLYTDKALHVRTDVASLDGSRFGMIFGLHSGLVKAILFSQETRIRDYYVMKDMHSNTVSSAWINKLESPRSTNKIQAITGSDDGHVILWDLTAGKISKDHLVEEGASIAHIKCDSKSVVVVATITGHIYMMDIEKENKFVRLGDVPTSSSSSATPSTIAHFEVDFDSEYLICGTEEALYRFDLKENGQYAEFNLKAFGVQGKITAFGIDKTAFSQSNTNRDTPGQYGRYLAAATTMDHVFVWLLQSEIDDTTKKIEPMRVRQSPFQVEISTLPGITAIALNSAVLLLGSYNGVTICYDLLTGEYLRVVSARFSKRALNLRNGPDAAGQGGLVPISHLEIDENASNPHGIIVVNHAVQYFDFGATFDETAVKKRGIKKRRRIPYYSGTAFTPTAMTKEELNRDIENDMAIMNLEDEELSQLRRDRERLEEDFQAEGLSEEDQLQYALMLSQEAEAGGAQADYGSSLDSEEHEVDDEDDLERAIQLSLGNESSAGHNSELEENVSSKEDEDFKRALALSIEDPSLHGLPESTSGASSSAQGEVDSDLELALKLSMQDR